VEFKRDREDEIDPVVQPEIKPHTGGCFALSVAKGLVTEPVLTIEIGGKEFLFMVDTGAMISLVQPNISKAQVQPCDVKARGVTGTHLRVLGEQEIEFIIRSKDYYMTFVHTFVVSPMNRCSSGILGMYFVQQVGAEISLTTQSLNIGRYSFPLMIREQGVSKIRHLITVGSEGSSSLDPEEMEGEPVEDWEGTVELAETVTVPPLSMRIARCRVVRRDVSTVVKVPRNQVVLVDPEGLPGILMARVIVKMSSTNVGGSDPYMVNTVKSPLVKSAFAPPKKFVDSSDSGAQVLGQDCGFLNVGSSTDAEDGRRRNPHLQMRYMAVGGAGECQPELPEDGLLGAPISHIGDLQAEISSLSVENRTGNYVDTNYINMAQEDKIEVTGPKSKEISSNLQNTRDATQRLPFKQRKKIQVLGYVPIQIANLSLEEIELGKYEYVGVASPTQIADTYDYIGNVVNSIEQTHKEMRDEFKDYLREKLKHLDAKDRCILEHVLQRYRYTA